RTLHRSKRKKVPLPVVAFVGYTNAGKSTLFNNITGSDVLAKDMLFATLDPTLRRIRLPGGTNTIVSDTVGFISDLPTHLIAAFRATLEEVQEADVIVHVHDASDAQASAQADDVAAVMTDLGVEGERAEAVVQVWNKIDMMDAEARASLIARTERGDGEVALSAITGEGVDAFLALLGQRISGVLVAKRIQVPPSHFAGVAWLYENSIVDNRTDREDGTVLMEVRVAEDTGDILGEHFPLDAISALD
ncbi:MAG: GTPase, partial [Pseudomonadota bacterium]